MTEIRTPRLILRPPCYADAARIKHYASDAAVARMTAAIPHPYTIDDAEAWLTRLAEGRAGMIFAIQRAGVLIGCVGCDAHEGDEAEFGYWLGQPWWGMGYATEAAIAAVGHVFDSTDLAALVSGHFEDNPASRRVLEKVGFLPERWVMRESLARGTDVRCLTYRLTRADALAGSRIAS